MITIDARMPLETTANWDRQTIKDQGMTPERGQPDINTASQQLNQFTNEKGGKISLKETEEAVKSIQKDMELFNTRIAFRVDNKSDEVVVEVIDKDTNKVIRQIPAEEMLRIKTAFKELIKGLLLDVMA